MTHAELVDDGSQLRTHPEKYGASVPDSPTGALRTANRVDFARRLAPGAATSHREDMSDSQQPASDDPVTFINVFEIPSDEVDEFITRWRERARLMSTAPGFRNAQLHRATSSETRFQLINVARWESYDHWHDAISDPRLQDEIRRVAPADQAATPNMGFYTVAAHVD